MRLTSTSAQCALSAGRLFRQGAELQEDRTIGDDFAYGHEMCAGFQRVFEDNGGKIIQKILTPLDARLRELCRASKIGGCDFPRHRRLERLPLSAAFMEYGLKDKMAVIGGMTALDESVLRNMGDEALGYPDHELVFGGVG